MRDYLASLLPSPHSSCRISKLPVSYGTATNCYPRLNGPFTPTDRPTDPPPSDYKLDRRGYTCLGSLLTHHFGLKGSLIVGSVMNVAQTKPKRVCVFLRYCLYHRYDVHAIVKSYSKAYWAVDKNTLLFKNFNF